MLKAHIITFMDHIDMMCFSFQCRAVDQLTVKGGDFDFLFRFIDHLFITFPV